MGRKICQIRVFSLTITEHFETLTSYLWKNHRIRWQGWHCLKPPKLDRKRQCRCCTHNWRNRTYPPRCNSWGLRIRCWKMDSRLWRDVSLFELSEDRFVYHSVSSMCRYSKRNTSICSSWLHRSMQRRMEWNSQVSVGHPQQTVQFRRNSSKNETFGTSSKIALQIQNHLASVTLYDSRKSWHCSTNMINSLTSQRRICFYQNLIGNISSKHGTIVQYMK